MCEARPAQSLISICQAQTANLQSYYPRPHFNCVVRAEPNRLSYWPRDPSLTSLGQPLTLATLAQRNPSLLLSTCQGQPAQPITSMDQALTSAGRTPHFFLYYLKPRAITLAAILRRRKATYVIGIDYRDPTTVILYDGLLLVSQVCERRLTSADSDV